MAEQKKKKIMNTQMAAGSEDNITTEPVTEMAAKSAAETVRDHIDAPILKTVAGLSLLGFKTHFSCCGFDYKGQPENKSHIMGKPYVFLDREQILQDNTLRQYLAEIAIYTGWKFESVGERYVDFYSFSEPHPNDHWRKPESTHFYEKPLCAIYNLNSILRRMRVWMENSATIIDGNTRQASELKYWQYQPAADWTVTREEWLAMPD